MNIAGETLNFTKLEKKVFVPEDVKKWEKSEAYQDILGFLTSMNDCVKGKKMSFSCTHSKSIQNLSALLGRISSWVDEIPPIDQPQRYGNKAFKDLYNKVMENAVSMLRECLPDEHHDAIIELSSYLTESFGNSIRIDYGTGHELSFVMFLCSLHKIGCLTREDSIPMVTVVFRSYMDLCRKLQSTYKMEPAGSQGVWSLDDFQFVPFIWGSSQLIMNPKISPELFTNENIVNEYADEYLFLGCIRYILSVKTGPFAEHSNQLWNISAVQSWTKINQGLFKMYKAEILNKFPIIQHVLFGSILSFSEAKCIRFHPPSDMGPVKSSIGMMTRPDPRSCMIPSGHGVLPLKAGMTPPVGMMPSRIGSMPLEVGIMPPRTGIPLESGRMPPRKSMPLVAGEKKLYTKVLPDSIIKKDCLKTARSECCTTTSVASANVDSVAQPTRAPIASASPITSSGNTQAEACQKTGMNQGND